MAVSLVCDATALMMTDPTPAQVRQFAMPLECIFCPKQKQVPLHPAIQPWAADLLEANVFSDIEPDADLEPSGDPIDEMTPRMSVVLGLGPNEQADLRSTDRP